jgi:predicted nuclease of predicted toxin-antitoxin system
MPMPIRFHLDESMPNAVADGLRRRGVDVSTSGDGGLLGASDEEQLNFARREGRVIITRDQDFLRLNARGVDHAGIIYWTERQRTVGQLIGALATLMVDYGEDELRGRVLFY